MSYLRAFLDFAFPRSCQICNRRLSTHEELICGECNFTLPRTNYHTDAYENPLAQLFWGLIPIQKAAALFFYAPNHEVSAAIYNLKYHNEPGVGVSFGELMAKDFSAADFFNDIDIIVPVPITWRRRMQREYNQSELIADGISKVTGIPVVTNAVKRVHFHESQTKMQLSERIKNVENAFRLLRPDLVAGKHVLLVDDIITTGSTIISCAKEIAKAGDVTFSVGSAGFTHNRF